MVELLKAIMGGSAVAAVGCLIAGWHHWRIYRTPPPLPKKWGFDYQWLGWRRCIWFAFQIDLNRSVIAIVFLGLLLSYGRKIDFCNYSTATQPRSPKEIG